MIQFVWLADELEDLFSSKHNYRRQKEEREEGEREKEIKKERKEGKKKNKKGRKEGKEKRKKERKIPWSSVLAVPPHSS